MVSSISRKHSRRTFYLSGCLRAEGGPHHGLPLVAGRSPSIEIGERWIQRDFPCPRITLTSELIARPRFADLPPHDPKLSPTGQCTHRQSQTTLRAALMRSSSGLSSP